MNLTVPTKSGIEVPLLHPKPTHIHTVDIMAGLSTEPRWRGQTIAPYYVAQHSVHVAELLADKPVAVQFGAVLHDSPEAYIGDNIKPLKKLFPELVALEEGFAMAIAERYGVAIHGPDIAWADQLACAIEIRDLMPFMARREGPDPRTDGRPPIVPLPPAEAGQLWLGTFNRLYNLFLVEKNNATR